MIKHHRGGQRHDRVVQPLDDGEVHEQLNMPPQVRGLAHRAQDLFARKVGIALPTCFEVKASASHAGQVQGGEFFARRVLVDDGNAACAGTKSAEQP